MNFSLKLFCTILFFLTVCCENEHKLNYTELIQGEWIFKEGTRNGETKGTEILKSLIFKFDNDQFECDLLPEMYAGLSTSEKFEINDKTILIAGYFELKVLKIDKFLVQLEFKLEQKGNEEIFNLIFDKKSSI